MLSDLMMGLLRPWRELIEEDLRRLHWQMVSVWVPCDRAQAKRLMAAMCDDWYSVREVSVDEYGVSMHVRQRELADVVALAERTGFQVLFPPVNPDDPRLVPIEDEEKVG